MEGFLSCEDLCLYGPAECSSCILQSTGSNFHCDDHCFLYASIAVANCQKVEDHLFPSAVKVGGPPGPVVPPAEKTIDVDRCYLMAINELNSDNPGLQDELEFIELIFKCSSNLKGQMFPFGRFFLAILSATAKEPEVVFFANFASLRSKQLSNDGIVYLVVGDENVVPTPDLKTSDPMVFTTKKAKAARTKGSQTMEQFLKLKKDTIPDGDKFPNAALLFMVKGQKVQGEFHKLLKPTAEKPSVVVTTAVLETMKQYLVDMVVYGRKAPTDRCTIFEDLHEEWRRPPYQPARYILRDWDKTNFPDRSLSRCTDSKDTFQPRHFKLSRPTPAAENDCTSAAQFYLEDLFREAATVRGAEEESVVEIFMEVPEEEKELESGSCSGSSTPAMYKQVSAGVPIAREQKIGEVSNIMTAGEQIPQRIDPMETADDTQEILQSDADIEALVEDINPEELPEEARMDIATLKEPKEWETTKYFDNAWLAKIKKHQSSIINVEWLSDKKVWVEYLYNTDDPEHSKFRCRLCYKHWNRVVGQTNKPDLAKEQGKIWNTKNVARDTLRDHPQTGAHRTIVEALKKEDANMIPERVGRAASAVSKIEDSLYIVTARMMKLVYMEAKLHIPFSQHRDIVSTLKANDMNIYLGTRHYEKTSATRMVLFISNEMQKTLVRYLLSDYNGPFSIIVDTATDPSLRHYLIVYIRFVVYKGRYVGPSTVLYRVIEMGTLETAEAMYNALLNAFREDSRLGEDFYQVVKRRLVAFVADGASVNMGRRNGLATRLDRDFSEKSLYVIHCMAHRLDLAIARAWKGKDFFKAMNTEVNNVYYFYNNKKYKRLAHYKETAKALDEKYYSLGVIFQVRWIASQFRALNNIKTAYKTVALSLEAIVADRENFDTDTRATATGIHARFKTREFVLLLHFLLDVTSSLRQFSEILQHSLAILSGKQACLDRMIERFEHLKTVNGPYVTELLNKAECGDSEEDKQSPCTIENFLDGGYVQWSTIVLDKDRGRQGLRFDRDAMAETLIEQLRNYFPDGKLNYFDIFDPTNMPLNTAETLNYGQEAITWFALQFKFDVGKTIDEWNSALLKMVEHVEYLHYKVVDPVTFWSFFLNEQVSNVHFSFHARFVVEAFLSIPVGSADCERGFSYLKWSKYDRRSTMTCSNLEATMRIQVNEVHGALNRPGSTVLIFQINGPSPEAFYALQYAKRWVKTGHLRTDDPSRSIKEKSAVVIDDDVVDEWEQTAAGYKFSSRAPLF